MDDDHHVRTVLESTFSPPRFEALVHADAETALAGLDQDPPDLILCDYLMPGMNGEEFVRRVRSSAALASVPFFFLTAVRLPESTAEALGADAVIRKPFPIQELRQRVELALGSPEPTEPEAAVSDATGPPDGHVAAQVRRSTYGRYSAVEHGGRRVQILTEELDPSRFAIVSTVTGDGIALRRVETSLPHPLARREDEDTVRSQVDFQHELVLANLGQYILEAPRSAVWVDTQRRVRASALLWVVRRVVSELADREDEDCVRRALLSSRSRWIARDESVRFFRPNGETSFSLARAAPVRLPRSTAASVAGWMLDLVCDARGGTPLEAAASIRAWVEERAVELEGAGFVEALRVDVGRRGTARVDGIHPSGPGR